MIITNNSGGVMMTIKSSFYIWHDLFR